MSPRRLLLLHISVPAVAGVTLASMITWVPGDHSEKDTKRITDNEAFHRSRSGDKPLPNDPEALRIAAMAGRTSPARAQLMAALSADEPDAKLAPLLAAILVADPTWLDTFLKSIPEARAANLVEKSLSSLIRLDARALWPVLRSSPYAAELAKAQLLNDATDDPFADIFLERPLIFESAGYDPSGALDFILDPANGIPDTAVRRISPSDTQSATRVLNEWLLGRWNDEHSLPINTAWNTLTREDPDRLATLREKLTDSQQRQADRMTWLSEFYTHSPVEVPDADELLHLNADEIEDVRQELSVSGIPMPLEILAKLTPDQRGEALRIQSHSLREFTPEQVASHLESMPSLSLLDTEKTMLLTGGANYLWEEAGNYQGALEMAAQISDPARSAELSRQLLQSLAREDPTSAIRYAPDIGDEVLRNEIIKIAERNQR